MLRQSTPEPPTCAQATTADGETMDFILRELGQLGFGDSFSLDGLPNSERQRIVSAFLTLSSHAQVLGI